MFRLNLGYKINLYLVISHRLKINSFCFPEFSKNTPCSERPYFMHCRKPVPIYTPNNEQVVSFPNTEKFAPLGCFTKKSVPYLKLISSQKVRTSLTTKPISLTFKKVLAAKSSLQLLCKSYQTIPSRMLPLLSRK